MSEFTSMATSDVNVTTGERCAALIDLGCASEETRGGYFGWWTEIASLPFRIFI